MGIYSTIGGRHGKVAWREVWISLFVLVLILHADEILHICGYCLM